MPFFWRLGTSTVFAILSLVFAALTAFVIYGAVVAPDAAVKAFLAFLALVCGSVSLASVLESIKSFREE